MQPHRNIGSLIPAPILSLMDSDNPLPPAIRFKGQAAEAVTQFNVVYISSYSGGIARFSKADADAAGTAPGLLFLALNSASAAGDELTVTLGPVNVGANTFGSTVGDPWYLSGTAGGTTSAAGAVARKIGEVAVVGIEAAGGAVTFCGWMSSAGGTSMVLDYLSIVRALTGTGEALKVTATMSHATQTAEGADVTISQVTNARTSGDLIAYKGTVVSLNGTTAGVDHVVFDANATAGDADSDHIGLRLGASIDVTIDSRAQTTGKNLWKVGDNLASALDVQEGANSYLKVVTTNSSERTEIRGPVPVGPTATAITGATVLTFADSGRVFTIDQDAAFDIDLPSPTIGEGLNYEFVLTDDGANNVTITTLGGATFVGTIHIDGTTIPATGSTLTLASGTAAIGDRIRVRSLTTGLYYVDAISSAAGGITVA